MLSLHELSGYLHGFLRCAEIADYAPNGVQVGGREEVFRLATGVSACMDLFRAAQDWQADLILVHHGLFWNKEPRVVTGHLRERLKFLLENDLTLMAYHLPLDCHPEVGNNAVLARLLELEPGKPFGRYQGTDLSRLGHWPTGLGIEAAAERLAAVCGGQPLVLPFGPPLIRTVALCSGAAPELIREAREAGADLFISGEATEYLFHYAREEGIHFMAAGHHRTERFGVQALGAHLAERFALEHRFIDIFNPI
ncbi:MAG: Nif3-like dinuclear metal center hexameric protein [Magnetococcales bacterium]|nr:Nif3-like dinuclear metal center hexameric protein [Magnetococcales bacterium]